MIQVENLIRKYGTTVAVGGISFEISPREVVGFLGPNGAGKTTTIKVLSGFLHPSSGKVAVAGRDVTEASLECRRQVGYLPENNPLYEEMEVSEYLDWTASVRRFSGPAKRAAMHRAVERCGLASVIGKDIGQLSKGFRQRVGLAQAMIHDPPILLLDEPTSGLDPNQAVEVRNLIAELRKEKTVMLSTHILSEVRASCDRVIIIHNGRIAAQGRPEELAASASPGQRLRLLLRGKADADSVRGTLSEMDGVSAVKVESGDDEVSFWVTAGSSTGDLREEVFKLAAKKRWPVLELYRETASLEEVFRNLTA